MIAATQHRIHDLSSLIEAYFRQGGPRPEQYASFTDLLHRWQELKAVQAEACRATEEYWLQREPVFSLETTIGRTYHKPLGYAGDYEVIDRIYRYHMAAGRGLRRWEEFYQQQPGAQAVRNRKAYFLKLLEEKHRRFPRGLRLLNLASGPAGDLLEAYLAAPGYRLQCDCAEQDPRAIAYARELLGSFAEQVRFQQRNVLRLQPERKYDLVWSAGLFDYLNDKTFVFLLRNALQWVKPGGEIVIGNFSPNNPSRAFMESMLDWRLEHRSAEQLKELARQAGVTTENNLRVDAEPLGINLFLRISLPH